MDSHSRLERVEPALRLLLALASVAYLLMFLGIAIYRMNYPFEFEWMEGGQVDHVIRILRGQKLYVEPSPEFVPFVYNPLFFYAAAPLMRIFGAGFFPLRLLSLGAIVVTLWILYRLVLRETASPLAGLVSAGFFAATYPLSGGWFDVGRVDSLFLCLLFAGAYVLRFHESDRGVLAAGGLLFLSFLTKQTAILVAVALTVSVFFDSRRRAILFAGMSIGLSGLAMLILNWIHDGWFFYIVTSVRNVPLDWPMFTVFWTRDMLREVPGALVLAVVGLARWKPKASTFRFYLLLAASLLFISWSSRFHNGGFINVLMTIHLQLALLIGFALAKGNGIGIRPLVPAHRVALGVLILAQFGWMVYNPQKLIPPERDRMAGEALIQKLRDIPGDILVPYHGYYSTLAGKNMHAHVMTMIEVVIAGDVDLTKKMADEIRADIRSQKFAAIVWDREWFQEDLEKYYVRSEKAFEREDVFWPITGYRTRPEWIYVPKKPQGGS